MEIQITSERELQHLLLPVGSSNLEVRNSLPISDATPDIVPDIDEVFTMISEKYFHRPI